MQTLLKNQFLDSLLGIFLTFLVLSTVLLAQSNCKGGENPAKAEPYYYQQWYLNKNENFYQVNGIQNDANIHMGEVWRQYSGKGVKIAIIDDGLDMLHEDIKNTLVSSYNILTDSTDVSHSEIDGHHGTAVTGIVAANINGKGIAGIAPDVEIIFLKYNTNMSDSDTIKLFHKAEEFGADIINCSWGTYDVSPSVKETIQTLANEGRNGKGIVIIFAAGNDDRDMGNDESAIPEVLAVGSSDIDNDRVWYSNYGEELDFLAPGGYDIGITTLDATGEKGVAIENRSYLLYNDSQSFVGTSASAPIVAGIVALLLDADNNLTREDIEYILRYNSDEIGDLEYENGRNDYYGYGKINLSKAMDMVSKETCKNSIVPSLFLILN